MSGPLATLDDLPAALELLDRSLAFTRGALSAVTDDALGAPTPCRAWDLAALLEHMSDALDAFAEGASGEVGLAATVPGRGPGSGPDCGPARVRVMGLQRQACDLLGQWSRPSPADVTIGDLVVDTSVVVHAAALEIAVHGWDVAQATGRRTRIPEDLARNLLPVATALVGHDDQDDQDDRGDRFGPVRPLSASAPADARLLGFLGRT